MLKGITVQLISPVQIGTDPFGRPVYNETAVDVDNVLVAQPSSEDVAETLNLTGKHVQYVLGVPKGDAHNWKNVKVRFFGQTFKTIGFPIEGIEAMVPTAWHRKVMVERYE